MLRAYIGIAKPDGLICFLPDTDRGTRLIQGQQASFWAVVTEEVAEQVRRELEAGERFRAMQVLDAMANEIHPLADQLYSRCLASS